MDAIRGEEEDEEKELERGKGGVCCEKETWSCSRSEDAVPQLFKEGRHAARVGQGRVANAVTDNSLGKRGSNYRSVYYDGICVM